MINKAETTKTIFFVRHGKSDWSTHLPDRQRPIIPSAYNDVKLVCDAFKNHFKGKLHLISSTAKRAQQTAAVFKQELGNQIETFLLDENLYTFSATDIKVYISKILDHWNHVMLVGHNPAFTEINRTFACKEFKNMPTAGLIQLDFFYLSRWKDATKAQRTLELFPKELVAGKKTIPD